MLFYLFNLNCTLLLFKIILNQDNPIEEIDKEIARLQALKKQNGKNLLKKHNLSKYTRQNKNQFSNL